MPPPNGESGRAGTASGPLPSRRGWRGRGRRPRALFLLALLASPAQAQIPRVEGVAYEDRPLLAAYGAFGVSVHALVPGDGSAPGTFVLAIPVEKKFGVDVGTAVIREAVRRGIARDLLVAFLAGETGAGHEGFRDLLARRDLPEDWALVFLDLAEPPGRVQIRHGGRRCVAPLDFVRPLPALFTAHGIPASFELRHNELYKLGLVEEPRVLALAWEAEVSGICLADGGPGARGGEAVTAEALAGFLLDYAAGLSLPVVAADRHYVFLPGGFLSEEQSAAALFAALSLFWAFLLVYSVVRRAKVLATLRLLVGYSWIFLVFLPLLAVILKGAGDFYALLLERFHALPPPADYPGAGVTVLLAIWLFYVPSHILDLVHVPGKHHFYGAAALAAGGAGLIAAAFLDFTYTPVFLWVFACAFAGAAFRLPVLVLGCALLLPLQAVLALAALARTGSPVLTRALRDGSWAAAFQVAALSLPFVLLLKRSLALRNHRRGIFAVFPFRLRVAFLGVTLAAMTAYAASLPKADPSPAPPAIPGLVVTLDERFFLGSRVVVVVVEAPGTPGTPAAPSRFTLTLEAGAGTPVVYSAPCPVETVGDGVVRFVLGDGPPNPLRLEITLPRDTSGVFRAEAVYGPGEPRLVGSAALGAPPRD